MKRTVITFDCPDVGSIWLLRRRIFYSACKLDRFLVRNTFQTSFFPSSENASIAEHSPSNGAKFTIGFPRKFLKSSIEMNYLLNDLPNGLDKFSVHYAS